jgi:hypothetical protein
MAAKTTRKETTARVPDAVALLKAEKIEEEIFYPAFLSATKEKDSTMRPSWSTQESRCWSANRR